MAAKRMAPGERLLDILAAEEVEGYEVHSRREGEAPERNVLTDGVPRRFVSSVRDEHGEVRVAPLVDQLLRNIRARRARRDPEAKGP